MLGYRPNPDEADRALTALSHACRRRLLFELYEEVNSKDGEAISYTDISSFEGEASQIRLYHIHLPQLEDPGYVEWNDAERTIARGPRWDEIVPFLELFSTHLRELPPFLQGNLSDRYRT